MFCRYVFFCSTPAEDWMRAFQKIDLLSRLCANLDTLVLLPKLYETLLLFFHLDENSSAFLMFSIFCIKFQKKKKKKISTSITISKQLSIFLHASFTSRWLGMSCSSVNIISSVRERVKLNFARHLSILARLDEVHEELLHYPRRRRPHLH